MTAFCTVLAALRFCVYCCLQSTLRSDTLTALTDAVPVCGLRVSELVLLDTDPAAIAVPVPVHYIICLSIQLHGRSFTIRIMLRAEAPAQVAPVLDTHLSCCVVQKRSADLHCAFMLI